MKSRIFSLLVAAFILSPIAHAEEERPYYAAARQEMLSPTGLRSLEHACKLVAAINALDWKAVEAAMPPTNNFLWLAKRDATAQKEWTGVGAYRSSDVQHAAGTVTHCFAYGPGRTNPHLAMFHYSLRDDTFTLVGFTILGW